MEIKEIIDVPDIDNPGRLLKVHVTKDELTELVSVGLFTMLRAGYISIKSFEPVENADMPTADDTVQ